MFLSACEEKTLLLHLAQGNPEALTAIYHTHWQALFLSAYNVLKDKKACEDIVQETFLQLWLKRDSLQVRESLKTYLSAAVRYQVFHHIRKASRRKPFTDGNPDGMGFTQDSEEVLLGKDLHKHVNMIVATLPDKCRTIYRLSREEQLSHKEIAQRLNISPKTVENQLTIALRRLRQFLYDMPVPAVS